ncbi:putative enzyme [Candidatus Hydrogenisulfobacillus filiaventi]|uniref:Putative enzyme n=1 Tax=Candidatus Hydrogenisulfobacillus filiaventi TaxID=2707344 RepID=A0A6F8ZDK6_9FIRM|nr:putative enzyme [Candidatus Hydrogenisulfobacillus filiaventi]
MLAECRTGTEEYMEGLVWGLSRNGVTVAGAGRPQRALLADQPCLGLPPRARPRPLSKLYWECWGVHRVPGEARVLHIPYLSHPPFRLRVPTLVTVHDLIPFRLPDYQRRWQERAYFGLLARRLPFATAFVAISRATYEDLQELWPRLAERTTIIPNGVHPAYFTPVDTARLEEVQRRWGLERHPRLLYVGGYDPRKNVITLIRAAAVLLERWQDGELVLVGAEGDRSVLEAVGRAGIGDRTILTPPLPREDLVALYQAADLFAFPSTYEGFGLPPAQALAVGVPAVVGRTPAVLEVVGEAALAVDPLAVEAWVEALDRLAASPALASELAAKGRERAAAFDWRILARRYRTLYEKVAQG